MQAKLSAVRSKLFLHGYENNTHEAEQALPAWRGTGRSSRATRTLLSSSDGARSCRIRLRCLLLYCRKKNEIKSSTEKQSSAIIVHEAKRTATSRRTTHTRQNNPYRLGLAPARVIGARGRGCPAATVLVAVVIARVVCCCIAQKNKKTNENNQHQVSPF